MPSKTRTVRARTEFGKRAPVQHFVSHCKLASCSKHDNCTILTPMQKDDAETFFRNRRLAERAVARTEQHFPELRGTFSIRQVAS